AVRGDRQDPAHLRADEKGHAIGHALGVERRQPLGRAPLERARRPHDRQLFFVLERQIAVLVEPDAYRRREPVDRARSPEAKFDGRPHEARCTTKYDAMKERDYGETDISTTVMAPPATFQMS